MRKKRRKKRTWNVPVVGKEKVIIRTYTSSNKKRRNHKAENKKKQKKQPCLSLFFFLVFYIMQHGGQAFLAPWVVWSYPNEKKKALHRMKERSRTTMSRALIIFLFFFSLRTISLWASVLNYLFALLLHQRPFFSALVCRNFFFLQICTNFPLFFFFNRPPHS